MINDTIEKTIELPVTQEHAWQAVSEARKFGEWFGVKLETPFEVGKNASGHVTHPGYEHLKWEVFVKVIDPPTRLSFTWHPYAIDPKKDYSMEAPTLVEFALRPNGCGVKLTISESGFEKIPADRRDEAFRMNSQGWDQQLKNISAYLQIK
jgi:uncharacterized protein YndB with AHSA1/START domain